MCTCSWKKVIQRNLRLIWSAERVKCQVNRGNSRAKLTKYASCTSSRVEFSKRPDILPAIGTRQWKFILGIFLTPAFLLFKVANLRFQLSC